MLLGSTKYDCTIGKLIQLALSFILQIYRHMVGWLRCSRAA